MSGAVADRLSSRLCAALADHLNKLGRPILPAGGELLWRWFAYLSSARTWGMAGPNPISLEAIDAYRRLTGWPIEERHVRILRAMDVVFLRHCATVAPGAPSVVAARPLTGMLFDAVFDSPRRRGAGEVG